MAPETPLVVVRPYRQPDDARATHAAFRAAVTRTAAQDYDPDQIAAWAGPEDVDLGQWNAHRVAAHTYVAVIEGEVRGFADFLSGGVLDMLFVHPDFGGRGVAGLLVATIKREALLAGLPTLCTYASRTAKSALEKFGFWVVAARPANLVGGQTVPNYEMRCGLRLGPPTPPDLRELSQQAQPVNCFGPA